jgi:DNA-binding HxlR family transcriptional regulator
MDLVGDRWAVVIIHELLLGPKGYITPAVLATRLRELTDRGVVEQTGAVGASRSQLTPWGREFETVLTALGVGHTPHRNAQSRAA